MLLRYFLSILILSLVIRCGHGAAERKVDQGEFKDYVDRFEADAKSKGRDLAGLSYSVKMHFGTTQSTEYAVCVRNFWGEREIVFHEGSWKGLEDTMKEIVVFHELGHCVLDREHRSDSTSLEESDGASFSAPASLMNPYLVTPSQYEANKDGYLNELFDHK